MSYTTGKHNLKFGMDHLNTEDYYNELNTSSVPLLFTAPPLVTTAPVCCG